MKVIKTPLLGLNLIQLEAKTDSRGYFMECYHHKKWAALGLDYTFVQDNQSHSLLGTIRGLHYQVAPYTQAKLVSVVIGAIWDVAVDVRPNSPTLGKWEGILLSAENKHQLLIPAGYAHGFAVTSPEAIVIYKCNQFYQPSSEYGIHPLDPTLAIKWPSVTIASPLLSAKDQQLPSWKEVIRKLHEN